MSNGSGSRDPRFGTSNQNYENWPCMSGPEIPSSSQRFRLTSSRVDASTGEATELLPRHWVRALLLSRTTTDADPPWSPPLGSSGRQCMAALFGEERFLRAQTMFHYPLMRGWQNAVGSLIEFVWLKTLSQDSMYWYMSEQKRG